MSKRLLTSAASFVAQNGVLTPIAAWALLAAGGACGGKATAPNAAQGNTTATTVSCATDSRVTPYAPGMQVKGAQGIYTFTLASSTPVPPANGTNTLVLSVADVSGAAQSNLAVTLTPFMPDHGHGTSVTPQVAASGSTYTITEVYLFMPGVWRLTFTAASADGKQTDTGVFTFCVAG